MDGSTELSILNEYWNNIFILNIIKVNLDRLRDHIYFDDFSNDIGKINYFLSKPKILHVMCLEFNFPLLVYDKDYKRMLAPTRPYDKRYKDLIFNLVNYPPPSLCLEVGVFLLFF